MSQLHVTVKDLEILKPCPFCGSTDFIASDPNDSRPFSLRCPVCSFSVYWSEVLHPRINFGADIHDLCSLASEPDKLAAFSDFFMSYDLLLSALLP